MEKIVLLGCGGHAKSVIDTIERAGIYEIVGFVDGAENNAYQYRGYRVIGTDDDLLQIFQQGIHCAFVCVGFLGKGNVRRRLYNQLKQIGYTLPCIVDTSAVIAEDVLLGEGTFVGKNAVINSDAKIGNMNIINTAAIVEHECIVGDFTHIAIGASVCGAVHIGEDVLIGANATVIQCVRVDSHVIVGAGALVLHDVDEKRTVVGVY